MLHIILGLGIVIGKYLKGIVLALLNTGGMQINDYMRLQLYTEASYIPAIIISLVIIRFISLKSRLPDKIPGVRVLIFGVWLFMVSITLQLASKLIPYAVYIIGKFTVTKIFISSSIPTTISLICILTGLFSVFLSANPSMPARND